MDSNGSGRRKAEPPSTSRDHTVVMMPIEEDREMDSLISTSTSSLEVSTFSPSPSRPPKVPDTLTRRKTLGRSAFSQPKSRFVEPSGPIVSSLADNNVSVHPPVSDLPSNKRVSFIESQTPREGPRNVPVTPKTPCGDEEEEEDVLKMEIDAKKKLKVFTVTEWVLLVCIWGFFVASLTVRKLQHFMLWGLEIWKWCVLVLVIVSGHLMVKWFTHVVVFLIEQNFLLKNKVLYFIYGVKKSVRVFLWLGLVLFTWELLINQGLKRSEHTTDVLNRVTRGLIASLVGALIWMIKALLVKLLAINFQCSRFFDRILESLIHQYILKTLSVPPVGETGEKVEIEITQSSRQLSFRSTKKEKEEIKPEVFDVDKFYKMKQEKVSAWKMKGLINVVTTSGLSTITNEIDQMERDCDKKKDGEITNEWEAKTAAQKIFKNVAKPDAKYIDVEDLLKFFSKTEVENVLPLFEGAAELKKIKKSALKNWVVKVYNDRKSLAHSLNDTKTVVSQLNSIVSGIVIVIIITVWLLIMGIATIKVLVFISSQMFLAAFMFGNTARTVFESIIFVFVMHPFDVGDRCVIDGVQMVVEEMNILTTIFLRFDNEKIYYPNSVLATKPISNFYRSPDMGDSVEFAIDVSTTVESLRALKASIKSFIESKPQHWHPEHIVVVKEIENQNKMKMALYVTHTMNHQNFIEKISRRTELVIEMKKIFEDLSIKYHLLPQEVHLSYIGSAATARTNVGH